jgi:hypothetical protein
MSAEPEFFVMWLILLLVASTLLAIVLTSSLRTARRALHCAWCWCLQALEASACFAYTLVYDILCCVVGCTVCLLEWLLCWLSKAGFFSLMLELICALGALPLAWYPMAALTVVPICCSIHIDWAVAYLGAYCVAGLLVSTAEQKRDRPESKPQDEQGGVESAGGAKGGGGGGLKSNFFLGMNIKIDLDANHS